MFKVPMLVGKRLTEQGEVAAALTVGFASEGHCRSVVTPGRRCEITRVVLGPKHSRLCRQQTVSCSSLAYSFQRGLYLADVFAPDARCPVSHRQKVLWKERVALDVVNGAVMAFVRRGEFVSRGLALAVTVDNDTMLCANLARCSCRVSGLEQRSSSLRPFGSP